MILRHGQCLPCRNRGHYRLTSLTTPGVQPLAPVAFTVGDAETPAGALQVTVTSSNPSLVPTAGLVLGGTGANRTLVVNPTVGQTGSASVTITVTDGGGLTTTRQFVVSVVPGGLPTGGNDADDFGQSPGPKAVLSRTD